jgi:hypothetical protein
MKKGSPPTKSASGRSRTKVAKAALISWLVLALLQDIELMPQDQDFGFQPPSQLGAVAQHTDEEEGNCDHQLQSCSDSAAAVTPADGAFGSDTSSGPNKPPVSGLGSPDQWDGSHGWLRLLQR